MRTFILSMSIFILSGCGEHSPSESDKLLMKIDSNLKAADSIMDSVQKQIKKNDSAFEVIQKRMDSLMKDSTAFKFDKIGSEKKADSSSNKYFIPGNVRKNSW